MSDGRERMVESALILFREHGYTGTGFRDVMEHSGISRGSIYHYFPGGKAELGAEVVRVAGEVIARRLERAIGSEDPLKAIDACFAWWARAVEASKFRGGCPVVAVGNEVHDDAPELADATAAVFERWQQIIAGVLIEGRVPPSRARTLAAFWVSALEGATVMSRATRDAVPFNRIRKEIDRTLREAWTEANC